MASQYDDPYRGGEAFENIPLGDMNPYRQATRAPNAEPENRPPAGAPVSDLPFNFFKPKVNRRRQFLINFLVALLALGIGLVMMFGITKATYFGCHKVAQPSNITVTVTSRTTSFKTITSVRNLTTTGTVSTTITLVNNFTTTGTVSTTLTSVSTFSTEVTTTTSTTATVTSTKVAPTQTKGPAFALADLTTCNHVLLNVCELGWNSTHPAPQPTDPIFSYCGLAFEAFICAPMDTLEFNGHPVGKSGRIFDLGSCPGLAPFCNNPPPPPS